MKPDELSVWWNYREWDRDADVAAGQITSYLNHLGEIDKTFRGLSDYVARMMSKGTLAKKLEREGYVSGFSYVGEGTVRSLSYGGSFSYRDAEVPDVPGEIRIGVDPEMLADEGRLERIFWQSIDFWNANEAGLFYVDPNFRFRWRWRRSGSDSTLLPNITLAENWVSQVSQAGGTLYIYKE